MVAGTCKRPNPVAFVSIVIPLYGEERYLTACLKALDENTDGHEVIVVDNATDYNFTADIIIRNPTNEGFGRACNAGAQAASAPIICFLNLDTEVQPGWLPPLLAAFDDPEVGVAGPRIIHPAGDLQTSGLRLWHGSGSAGGEEIKQELPTRTVDGVTGACLMIRKSVFDAVGQFDTRFLNGYEDCALCMSVNEAGYQCKYVAESTIVHHESVSGPERWIHAQQNVATMNAIWGNR